MKWTDIFGMKLKIRNSICIFNYFLISLLNLKFVTFANESDDSVFHFFVDNFLLEAPLFSGEIIIIICNE
jgi:hypothetical protein